MIDNCINSEDLFNNPNATIIDTKQHNSTRNDKDAKEINKNYY